MEVANIQLETGLGGQIKKLKKMKMNFNDFYWHDAIVKNIQIDRNNPGHQDTITLEIEWPEENGKANFVFEDVYWTTMNLNFGVVADETILSAFELDEHDQDLSDINSKWGKVLKDVKLKIYKFDLNSTGSEIKIIAKGFREDKL